MNAKLQIPVSLAAKIGSILVHVENECEARKYSSDHNQIYQLIQDKEIQDWLIRLRQDALVPVKR